MMNCELSNPIEQLELYGVYASSTKGKSMRPLFKTGRDAVVLKKVDKEIKKYDVVLYQDRSGKYILHRVIGKKDGVFIIRGDNTFRRELVKEERILAYLISFNRQGKHHTVEDFGYKLYSRVWNFIYPIRFLFYKFKMLVKKILRIKKRTQP